MENPMETKRKKSSAIVTPVLVTIIGLISLALVVIIAGVGIGLAFRNRGNSTNDGFVAPTLFETRGGAVLNARILSGGARVGNAINRRIRQDDVRRQTLLANAFKNLTINIGTGIAVAENAIVNLGAETESSAGTLANITAARNQLPLSTSLLPLAADWKQATITLGNNVGSLSPAVVGNQVNQIIHDLNAYVIGETISNQSVIFINFIGTAPTINTANGVITLTIKLRTLHYRGCLNCNSTLLAALRQLLSISRISCYRDDVIRTLLNLRFASQFAAAKNQVPANYQPRPLTNVEGMNFVLENSKIWC
ncbi:hypothetical protein ACOME3_010679 [Neoechinorhynchus agilis]